MEESARVYLWVPTRVDLTDAAQQGAGNQVAEEQSLCSFKNCTWPGKMAQGVKALASRPDDLSAALGTSLVQGENRLL